MKILLFILLFLIVGSLLYAAFSNAPVLTVIGALIGLSVYLVIRSKKSKKRNLEG